jgi:xylulokinase
VAFALRDCYEVARSQGIELDSTMICGGGAKSPLWRKIVANVLNLTVNVPANEQGPGMGGAMLAMVACGAYPSVKDAAKAIVKITKTEVPDPVLVQKYEKRYQQFRTLYPSLKDFFKNLSEENG